MGDVLVAETKESAAVKAKQIPVPTGYRILCMVPQIDDTHRGGRIAKAESTKTVEEQTTVTLYVVKLGKDAYKDKVKFPTGPWCKEGDFIICRAYTGTRLLIHGTEWRLINDDSVDGVVEDPRGISRAGGNL